MEVDEVKGGSSGIHGVVGAQHGIEQEAETSFLKVPHISQTYLAESITGSRSPQRIAVSCVHVPMGIDILRCVHDGGDRVGVTWQRPGVNIRLTR